LLADVLLTPTRLYVRSGLAAARQEPAALAMAHITGGGLVENLPRVLPDGTVAVLDAGAWPLPPLLRWLKRFGRLDELELARTFNAGIGMALVARAEDAGAIRRRLEGLGETVFAVGRIEADEYGGAARVEIRDAERAWADDAPPS
jgi:phosphoribosylformylglycinamidine cyclo-ligase